MATAKKRFDCVEFKRKAQLKIHNKLRYSSHKEEAEFLRRSAMSGPLGKWWSAVTEAGRKKLGRI